MFLPNTVYRFWSGAEIEQTQDLISQHLVGLLKPTLFPLQEKNTQPQKVAPIWKQHSKMVCSNQNESILERDGNKRPSHRILQVLLYSLPNCKCKWTFLPCKENKKRTKIKSCCNQIGSLESSLCTLMLTE